MAITKPPVLPAWADAGDKVQPSNAELSVGWPVSSTPPSRQRFNWVLNYVANAVRYFSRRGLVDYDAAETYMTGDRIIGDDGKTYRSLIDNNTAQTPSTSPTQWEVWALTLGQAKDAFAAINGSSAKTFDVAPATAAQHAISIASLSTIKGIQQFTNNGTFIVPTGVTKIFVSACGGGGGGGAAASNASLQAGGGGGGSGYWTIKQPFSVSPGQVLALVIGGGGAGAPFTLGTANGAGGITGGSTTIAALGLALSGGNGGGGANINSTWANPGGPGDGGGGGSPGSCGFSRTSAADSNNICRGGDGASTPFGSGGTTSAWTWGGTGQPGIGYGSGGSGGQSSAGGNGGGGGGSGSPGVIFIEW